MYRCQRNRNMGIFYDDGQFVKEEISKNSVSNT